MKIKYEVIPVQRYMAVRFVYNEDGKIDKSETCGEFENGSLAYSAASAMYLVESATNATGAVTGPSVPGWLVHEFRGRMPRFQAGPLECTDNAGRG